MRRSRQPEGPGAGAPAAGPGAGAPAAGPAFYALRGGHGWRDVWIVLHPPYTAWHLSYVVLGACLAPVVHLRYLLATLLAFFLAVGVAAHALDEWNGRPLGTTLPGWLLLGAGLAGLGGAIAVGAAGVAHLGAGLVPFIVLGAALVLSYDLELWGGRFHTAGGFAASWGAFPVLTSYFAQAQTLRPAGVAGAAAAFGLSWAQRRLSTPARFLRRRAGEVHSVVSLAEGEELELGKQDVLAPLDGALKAMSWAMVALATSLALARLG